MQLRFDHCVLCLLCMSLLSFMHSLSYSVIPMLALTACAPIHNKDMSLHTSPTQHIAADVWYIYITSDRDPDAHFYELLFCEAVHCHWCIVLPVAKIQKSSYTPKTTFLCTAGAISAWAPGAGTVPQHDWRPYEDLPSTPQWRQTHCEHLALLPSMQRTDLHCRTARALWSQGSVSVVAAPCVLLIG